MFRTLRLVGLGLFAAALATPLSAETTPGPPDWADAGGSIYLDLKEQAAEPEEPAALPPPTVEASPIAAPERIDTPPKVDTTVTPAIHHATDAAADEEDQRRLAPPSNNRLATRSSEADQHATHSHEHRRPPIQFGMPVGSLYTILSALAIVIGLLLMFAWLLRRGGKKASGTLPGEVVSVLGRVQLAPRQFAHLLRVGNKLVLVTLTPNGAETLTEVTDPVEVDRLTGLCQQFGPHSTTKAFEHVFRQLSRETAPSGFYGGDSLPQSISSAAAAYRAHRGDTARG
jgi:flagellar biogenesis protein FliO